MPGEENLVDPVLLALGQRLLDARLDYGRRQRPIRSVTQVEIGRVLDVSGVTVGNWEAGKNDPGVPMLNRLAELYGVNDVWLMTGKGAMRDDSGEGGQGAERTNKPSPKLTPDQIVRRDERGGVPTAQQPGAKKVKRRPGDKSAVA